MAEYLAPAVYVEEVDTGAKPIEGVSTSTAGMVGMAERGPTNVPILITSIGEYSRWFGGRLARRDFIDPTDPDRAHCYLPHAVEGFFTNGGKRTYVVRVAPAEAQRADMFLFDRGEPGGAGTMLLRRAGQGGGLAPEPELYVLDTTGIAALDTIRIGDGSRAEYHQVVGAPAAATQHIALSAPIQRAHDAGATLSIHAEAAGASAGPHTLGAAANVGATVITIDSPDDLTVEPTPFLLEVSTDGVADIAAVRIAPVLVTGTLFRITLNEPLGHAHAVGAAVEIFASAAGANTLDVDAAPGDPIVFADADIAFADAIVEIDEGNDSHEVRRRGDLATLTLEQPLTTDAPVGTAVSHVDLVDGPLVKTLTAPTTARSRVITLNDRVDLEVGLTIRIGVAPAEEYAVILALPGSGGAAPDAGTVTLSQPLGGVHANGTTVVVQDVPAFPAGGHADTQVIFDSFMGAAALIVAGGQDYVAGEFVRLRRPDGGTSFHRLGAPIAFANTGRVALSTGLARTHERGSTAVERRALIEVQALDVGSWGNRLLISVEDELNGLAARAQTVMINPPLEIRVTSLTGIEPGTLIELLNPATLGTALLKVRRIDRSNRSITFDAPGLDAAALAALGPIGGPLEVRSREFALTVRLRRRPDPAVPSRDSMILETESFRHLSMDHRHSRYFQSVIGDINGPLRLEDRRPEGESALIRVSDVATPAESETIRPGPEGLVDILPTGLTEPARHPLANGDDSIATIIDDTYLGADNVEPLARTGLHALRTLQNVSIVAIPGQGSAPVQAGLIAHCELMRYRFAILDAEVEDASLADVQQQRQTFDTKYAGLYYPWLTIPDPDPDTLAVIRDFALPPSGHMLGIYARTDEERGVHKAPANEVVRGITGLTRRLSKGEHDILNPSPVNINVIRDFRPDGRGIRVWGARCITSDSDHKYVPVRRLLIFLEQSIERGLQWVVFEPNSEILWARVRRTIRDFLTDVWRSGALEGAKPEEAFFVKCDRTTMSQAEIDNGRLVCVVGVAPVKPAEFVIVRIGLFTAHAEECPEIQRRRSWLPVKETIPIAASTSGWKLTG